MAPGSFLPGALPFRASAFFSCLIYKKLTNPNKIHNIQTMTLNHLHKLAENVTLTSEENAERFDILRGTRKNLLKEQLLPRVRAPYQLKSLEQSVIEPGRILLSWKDLGLARTGVEKSFEIEIPAGQQPPQAGTSLNLQFNDQLISRPELAQANGEVRPPKAYGRNGAEEALRDYTQIAARGIERPIDIGSVIVGESQPTENGGHRVSFTVKERDIQKLDWHMRLNYQGDLSGVIEMAPQIVLHLRQEAEQFVADQQPLLKEPDFDKALLIYALASFSLPVNLMGNQGQALNNRNFDPVETEIRQSLDPEITRFAKRYGDNRLTRRGDDRLNKRVIDMIEDGETPDGMTEETQAEIGKRVDKIDTDEFLQKNNWNKIAAEIFLNHLEGDTRLTKIKPIIIEVATLGLPGFDDQEQTDNSKIYESIRNYNEEQTKAGSDQLVDTTEEISRQLLETEASRMSVIVGPITANGIQKLRQHPNARSKSEQDVMYCTLTATGQRPPMTESYIRNKLSKIFLSKANPADLPEIENKLGMLSRRISAGWYNNHGPDRILRNLVMKGPDSKELKLIEQKGSLPILKTFAEFTSYTAPGQKARSPLNNRLVTYALLGMNPGHAPREATADFALRAIESQRMPIEASLRRRLPSEILCADLAAETAQNAGLQDSPAAKKRFETSFGKLVTLASLALTPEPEPDYEAINAHQRAGIRFNQTFQVKGEENQTSRQHLLQVALEAGVQMPSSNLSEVERTVKKAFAPYEALAMPVLPTIEIELDHKKLQLRNETIEGFGALGNDTEDLQKASVTESMLPLIHAKDQNLAYKLTFSNLAIENLTSQDQLTLGHMVTSAEKQARKEMAESSRAESLQADYSRLNADHAKTLGNMLKENLSLVKNIPEVVRDIIVKLRINTEILETRSDEKSANEIFALVQNQEGNFHNQVKTAKENVIENDLLILAKTQAEEKAINSYLKTTVVRKEEPHIELHKSGELTSNRHWLAAKLHNKAIDMEAYKNLKKEFTENPPKDGPSAIRLMAEQIKYNLLIDETPSKKTPVIIKTPTEGATEESLIKAYQQFYAAPAAIRNLAATTHQGPELTKRYDGPTEPVVTTTKSPDFI